MGTDAKQHAEAAMTLALLALAAKVWHGARVILNDNADVTWLFVPPKAQGYTNVTLDGVVREIGVSADLSPERQVAVLAHELAHAERAAHVEGDDSEEVMAETASTVITAALGLDTAEVRRFSAEYLATWGAKVSEDERLAAVATGEEVGQTILAKLLPLIDRLLSGATARQTAGVSMLPAENLARELTAGLADRIRAGRQVVRTHLCIMEIHAGARLATMLQAVAHNLATVVADLAMVEEILNRRTDTDPATLASVVSLRNRTALVADDALVAFGQRAGAEHPTEPDHEAHDHRAHGERSPLTFAQTQ